MSSFLVGEILGAKRQHLPEACSPASGPPRALPRPSAQMRFSPSKLAPASLESRTHIMCFPLFYLLHGSHHSLERRRHRAHSASCIVIPRVSLLKEKGCSQIPDVMANIPKRKKHLTHASLFDYGQAMMLLFYRFTNEGQKRTVLFSGQVRRVLTTVGLDV